MTLLIFSLKASLLILAVTVIRLFFIHRLPKKTFLALWLLAVGRLLLPVNIPTRFSIGSIIDALSKTLQRQAAPLDTPPLFSESFFVNLPNYAAEAKWVDNIPVVINQGGGQAAGFFSGIWEAIVAMPWYYWLWLAGLVACMLFFVLTHLRCRAMYQTALPVENNFVQEWLDNHPVRRKVRIKQSDKISAPFAYSIWWPVILLPKDTNWQDEAQLSYILAHEYVHIQRFDACWKWILAAALAVHWFNPLVWLMYILANRDLEISCDETVVQKYGESAKPGYALTLISIAERRNRLMPLCNNFSKNYVEERILSIMRLKKTTLTSVLAAMVIVAGIALVFATSRISEVLAAETATEAKNAVSENDPGAATEMRTLFVTKGATTYEITYDGVNWGLNMPALEDIDWPWYTYEEFLEFVESAQAERQAAESFPKSLITVDKESLKLEQTLADIENGIKVSKYQPLYVRKGSQTGAKGEWIVWYCFAYSFMDKAGNEVNLGPFETRDQLFENLKDYYENEVAAGNLSHTEADIAYKKLAHSIRNNDEIPLKDKLLNILANL